jgi:uncharacterized membrane protein YbaN (DUF454 family)
MRSITRAGKGELACGSSGSSGNQAQARDRTNGMKIIWNIAGSVAVVLAILGVFLPLLPTTPFLLLASACYLRGSKSMHRWLLNNALFGEYLRNVEEKRGIPVKAKAIALLLMWASLSWSIYLVRPMWAKAALVMTGAAVSIFLLRMNTPKAGKQHDEVRR